MAARKPSRKMEWKEWQAWQEENEVEIAKIQWISYAKGVWAAGVGAKVSLGVRCDNSWPHKDDRGRGGWRGSR